MSEKAATKTKPKLAKPNKWKVVIINDDFTPMDFVGFLLMNFFGKSASQSDQIIMEIHNKGKGIAGVYTLEVAEAKLSSVSLICRNNGHPLKLIIEPE